MPKLKTPSMTGLRDFLTKLQCAEFNTKKQGVEPCGSFTCLTLRLRLLNWLHQLFTQETGLQIIFEFRDRAVDCAQNFLMQRFAKT
jgi:hypothetical protein